MQIKWRKLPEKSSHSHKHIKNDDICIYSREYVSEGYTASQTNSLISNFKKSPFKKTTNPSEWWHRQKAIEQFKIEIEQLFRENLNITITAIPSSKHKNDPEYDNRFEDLFNELLKSRANLNIEWPIEIKQTIQASHTGGKREPEYIKGNYTWKGFKQTPKTLCVFDDVLTKGGHFRAVSDFLRENGYKGRIIGIFWSRTISPEQQSMA